MTHFHNVECTKDSCHGSDESVELRKRFTSMTDWFICWWPAKPLLSSCMVLLLATGTLDHSVGGHASQLGSLHHRSAIFSCLWLIPREAQSARVSWVEACFHLSGGSISRIFDTRLATEQFHCLGRSDSHARTIIEAVQAKLWLIGRITKKFDSVTNQYLAILILFPQLWFSGQIF